MQKINDWKPTHATARAYRNMSVLYGSKLWGALPVHAHQEVQVSVHFNNPSKSIPSQSCVHLYPSLQPHAGGWKRGNEVVVVQIAPVVLMEVRQELSKGYDFDLVPAHDIRDPVLEGLGLIIREEYQRPEVLSDLYVESVGYTVARHLLRKHAAIPIPRTPAQGLSETEYRLLCRYVQENLQRGFAVRELAAAIQVGPSTLAQKLSASLEQSPWRFVQHQRILHARALLKNGRIPLAQIAAELGFTDQSHFTNSFRRAVGLSPKAYRDNL